MAKRNISIPVERRDRSPLLFLRLPDIYSIYSRLVCTCEQLMPLGMHPSMPDTAQKDLDPRLLSGSKPYAVLDVFNFMWHAQVTSAVDTVFFLHGSPLSAHCST